MNAEKNKNFLTFYGGIIYYSPDNSIQEEIIKEVNKSKDYIFLYYNKLNCRYLGFVDIKLFPEEMKETKLTIKINTLLNKGYIA